jgi:putative FmdB family regulatory protein
MPFYEYECSRCGHHAEVLQKITDAPLRKCPACGKNALRKLVSAPVFRLKGSGWYETDFKGDKDSKRNLAGGDSEEKKAADTPAAEKAGDKAGEKPAEKSADKAGSADAGSGADKGGEKGGDKGGDKGGADKPSARKPLANRKPAARRSVARKPARRSAGKSRR